MRPGSKPISGGLPHCFPQFGPGEIQQHGFARNLDWEVVQDEVASSDGGDDCGDDWHNGGALTLELVLSQP